jgi:type II secretory pathway pseudopilin PulG
MARILSKAGNDQSGMAFIETLIALALLGLVAVAFLSGLATASRANIIADEQTTAESLARSQMEWAKEAAYVYSATSYTSGEIPGGDDFAGYSATIDASPLHNPDDGIQKIAVIISHYTDEVLKVEGYKVDR